MMFENGFIKIYRSILNWEWYDDVNTKSMFIHLLLTVSIKDDKWHGIEIKRGSRVSSYSVLASELGMSIRQARTAIKHLVSTGEVTKLSTPKFTVFALNNYERFQQVTNQPHDKRQSNDNQSDKRTTNCRQQYKNNKEYIRNKESGAPAFETQSAADDVPKALRERNF